MLAAINRREANATMMAGLGVLIVAIYTGYAIPRPSMKVWFRWLSYAQPIPFGFEAILTNECKPVFLAFLSLLGLTPSLASVSPHSQRPLFSTCPDWTRIRRYRRREPSLRDRWRYSRYQSCLRICLPPRPVRLQVVSHLAQVSRVSLTIPPSK